MASIERIPASCFGKGTWQEGRRQAKAAKNLDGVCGKVSKSTALVVLLALFAGAPTRGYSQSVMEAPGLSTLPASFAYPQVNQAEAIPAPPTSDQASAAVAQGGEQAELFRNEPYSGAQYRNASDQTGGSSAEKPQEGFEGEASLQLSDVVASVYQAFPLIAEARLQRSGASAQLLGANGAYDTKLKGYSFSEPTGFYRNFRNGLGLARQTWWGGYVAAGYRVGRGDFQPWYKERETNEGGEFALTGQLPLLQGRAIDPERVAVFQASIDVQAANPQVQLAILEFSRDAALAYWQWIASGEFLEAQRELLDLALQREKQFAAGVNAGKFPEIDLVFNQQLVAERQGSLLAAEQKYLESAFKLSIFLRDEEGSPMVPQASWLPVSFPVLQELPVGDFQQDLMVAMRRRPEPQLLRLEIRRTDLDRQLASNQLLPQLDVIADASQDVGLPSSSINDKGQFELIVGIQGELPLQRRKARGKFQLASVKINQMNQKLRLVQDKIAVELQTSHNALRLAQSRISQAQAAVLAALDTLKRYRFAFERGKTDLIYINFLETKLNESELKLVGAQQDWYTALAEMQFALGLDPLDEAFKISTAEAINPPQPVPQP